MNELAPFSGFRIVLGIAFAILSGLLIFGIYEILSKLEEIAELLGEKNKEE